MDVTSSQGEPNNMISFVFEGDKAMARERLLYMYGAALDKGDFETVEAILRQSVEDPDLVNDLMGLDDAYQAEYEQQSKEAATETVRTLLNIHIPSGVVPQAGSNEDADNEYLPPVTVGDVMARINSDAALKNKLQGEIAVADRQLGRSALPLPGDLSRRSVSQVLQGLGVSLSRRFEEVFRTTAIFLSMGREQSNARMAATRKQRQAREGNSATSLKGRREQRDTKPYEQQQD